jgi:hypothetical protein
MGIGNGEVAAIPSACVRERCAVLANYFEFLFGWLRVGGGIYHRYLLGLIHFGDFWEAILNPLAIMNYLDFGWRKGRSPARLASGSHSYFWQYIASSGTKRRLWGRRRQERHRRATSGGRGEDQGILRHSTP